MYVHNSNTVYLTLYSIPNCYNSNINTIHTSIMYNMIQSRSQYSINIYSISQLMYKHNSIAKYICITINSIIINNCTTSLLYISIKFILIKNIYK